MKIEVNKKMFFKKGEANPAHTGIAVVAVIAILAVTGLINTSGNGITGAATNFQGQDKNCGQIAENLINTIWGRMNNAEPGKEPGQLHQPQVTQDGDTFVYRSAMDSRCTQSVINPADKNSETITIISCFGGMYGKVISGTEVLCNTVPWMQ